MRSLLSDKRFSRHCRSPQTPPAQHFLENHRRYRKTIRDSHLTRYPLYYTSGAIKSVRSDGKVSPIRMEWPIEISYQHRISDLHVKLRLWIKVDPGPRAAHRRTWVWDLGYLDTLNTMAVCISRSNNFKLVKIGNIWKTTVQLQSVIARRASTAQRPRGYE